MIKKTITLTISEELYENLVKTKEKREFNSVPYTAVNILNKFFNKPVIKIIKNPIYPKELLKEISTDVNIKNKVNLRSKKENTEYFEPLLKKAGAKLLKKGMYELKGFLCYSSTGKAINKANGKIKRDLEEFLINNKNNK